MTLYETSLSGCIKIVAVVTKQILTLKRLEAHQPWKLTVTSNSRMSVSIPSKVDRLGLVLPKSPWTNSLIYLLIVKEITEITYLK